jgi:hypothetical protein
MVAGALIVIKKMEKKNEAQALRAERNKLLMETPIDKLV